MTENLSRAPPNVWQSMRNLPKTPIPQVLGNFEFPSRCHSTSAGGANCSAA